MTWRRIGAERGFTGGRVTGILQDRKGIIWIGAQGGLFRYDGKGFRDFRPALAAIPVASPLSAAASSAVVASTGTAAQKGTAPETAVGLASSEVSALVEDTHGDLWIGTEGAGLFRLELASGSIRPVRLVRDDDPGSSTERILALAAVEDGQIISGTGNGSIYLGGGTGFSRLENPSPSQEAVRALLADSAGNLWAGTDGGGLARYSPEGRLIARYLHDPAQPDSLASSRITALLEDSLGYLWIGLAEGGLDLFSEGRFLHAKTPSPRTGKRTAQSTGGDAGSRATSAATTTGAWPSVTSIMEDSRGQIWMGFAGGSLGILDPSTMEIQIEAFGEGAEVSALFRDRRGLVWIGLDRGGLMTGDLRSAGFERSVRALDGSALGGTKATAAGADGRVHIATDTGILAVFESRSGGFRRLSPGLSGFDPAKVEAMLAAADGSLWMGGGWPYLVRILPSGAWKRYPREGSAAGTASSADKGRGAASLSAPSLPSTPVSALLELDDGTILIGTAGGGLSLLDPSTGGYSTFPEGPDPARGDAQNPAKGLARRRSVTSLVHDAQGHIYAGFSDAGIARFIPDGRGGYSLSEFNPALGDRSVASLHMDSKGALLVGTGGAGLSAFDPETGRLLYRGAEAGLVADSIYGIVEDPSGTLWVASSEGLYSLDPERSSSYLYGYEDGLCPGGMEAGAIVCALVGAAQSGPGADSWIFAATSTGIARFDPRRVPRYSPAPEVVISLLSEAGTGTPLLRTEADSRIRLRHDNAGLRFDITVIDYLAPERTRYAIQRLGRSATWTQLGRINSGYIAPLPPGTFMFRVKAANANGTWNDYGAPLSITVLPPWWGTWWFRMAAGGFLVLALGGAVAGRIHTLRRRNAHLARLARHIDEAREEERKSAARDVHDDIGQHLMVLNLHAYWLASHQDASPEARATKLAELRATIQEAMAAVKTVAGRLRPDALDSLDYPDAVRLYVRNFSHVSGIGTELTMAPGWKNPDKPIADALFRIMQEMLSNVARHSGAKHVRVSFSFEPALSVIPSADSGFNNKVITNPGRMRLLRGAKPGGSFVLSVADDGVGAPALAVDAADSFGILGMRERCAAFGGRLEIRQTEGQGFTIVARIPQYDGRKAAQRRNRLRGQTEAGSHPD